VVGVPDPVWGEKVSAVVVLDAGKTLDIETLRAWGKEHLAPYKVPKDLVVLEKLPGMHGQGYQTRRKKDLSGVVSVGRLSSVYVR